MNGIHPRPPVVRVIGVSEAIGEMCRRLGGKVERVKPYGELEEKWLPAPLREVYEVCHLDRPVLLQFEISYPAEEKRAYFRIYAREPHTGSYIYEDEVEVDRDTYFDVVARGGRADYVKGPGGSKFAFIGQFRRIYFQAKPMAKFVAIETLS